MRHVLRVLCVCALAASAGCGRQQDAAPPPGGFFPQEVASPESLAIAARAVALLRERQRDPSLTLAKLRSLSSQVVAGMNYELTMDVSTANGPRTIRLEMSTGLGSQAHDSITSVTGL